MNLVEAQATPQADLVEILIASAAAPEHGKPRVGAVVLGTGNGHVPIVRALAQQGVAAIQVRLIRDNEHHWDLRRRYMTYDDSGVVRCQRAMSHLSTTQGVEKFILYGNCALANISFNTALVDTRVAGLVLLNPRVAGIRASLFFKLRSHLMLARSWKRLLRGGMRPWRRSRPTAAAAVDFQTERMPGVCYVKDMTLPHDFEQQLLGLSSRGLRTLMVFSRTEPTLPFFQRMFRNTLAGPIAAGKLRVAVLDTDSHDPFARHDDSATALSKLIRDWVIQIGAAPR